MVSISRQTQYQSDITFTSRSKSFQRIYKQKFKEIPLKDRIMQSINDESNLLGEGLSKKGYNLVGIKDYIIRIYKNCFTPEDLNQKFIKPAKSYLNSLEGIALCIPGKIDIVKRKSGTSLGVDNYADRIQIRDFPPLRNVCVTREESLKSLEIYEKLKDFPIKSYKQAYKQIKKFCKHPDYQFDIISPNNILVDIDQKKINLIDPVSPKVNRPVHGSDVDFSQYHGCDSLYPILCDFLMQKEHLNNLTPEEQQRWVTSINKIITKSIKAGSKLGLRRNIDQLKLLYTRITKFWGTDELNNRYNNFLDMYAGSIDPAKTIEIATNYQNKERDRIRAIKQLYPQNFKEIKPALEKILEAPHQPKVEFPEIINAVLDKTLEYGNEAASLTPALEKLFGKEIFYTTKKRLYHLFTTIQPENKTFLNEMKKSATNPFEKTLYKNEFEELYKKMGYLSASNKQRVRDIYRQSLSGEKVSEEVVNKLWMSRTCTKSSSTQKKSLKDMINRYKYIEANRNRKPHSSDLIEIHKIILKNSQNKNFLAGRLRTPDTDELVKQVFNITKDTTKTVTDYSSSKEVINGLKKLDRYIDKNYDTAEPFILAAEIFNEVIRIHPFVDGNGRASRLFVEQFLLSKGFHLNKWPEETLYRKICSTSDLAEALKQNSSQNLL